MKKKKFTPSELRWLAENLDNEQIASLLESDQTPNVMQGVPTSPGMQTVDNNAAQKPADPSNPAQQTQPQQNQQGNNAEFEEMTKQFCQSIMKGNLSGKDPKAILKIFQSKPGSMMYVIPKAVKLGIEYIGKIDLNQGNNLAKAKNITGGLSVALATMELGNSQVAESIVNKLKSNHIDISSLASNIRDNNRYSIYEAGKAAYTSVMDKDAQELQALAESFAKKYGKIISNDKKAAINVLKESVSAIVENTIESDIEEYYKTNKMIKKIVESLEEHNIHPNKFKKSMELVANKKKALNEAISATKYSIAFYKKNKDEFENKLA